MNKTATVFGVIGCINLTAGCVGILLGWKPETTHTLGTDGLLFLILSQVWKL